jgi:hypothetical protein
VAGHGVGGRGAAARGPCVERRGGRRWVDGGGLLGALGGHALGVALQRAGQALALAGLLQVMWSPPAGR